MDPSGELIELCDEQGRTTGVIKPRYTVHREGDWHRAFHCWVVGQDSLGAAYVVMQRRSFKKATWQGLWDVSVGGHYTAGEQLEGGLREIHEELGLTVEADELVQAGWRREQVFYPNGVIEREVQDVYFLRRTVDPVALRPDPAEVIAVALVPTAALARLADGKLPQLAVAGAEVAEDGGIELHTETVTTEGMVPRAGRYHEKVARFAERLVAEPGASRRRRWW